LDTAHSFQKDKYKLPLVCKKVSNTVILMATETN